MIDKIALALVVIGGRNWGSIAALWSISLFFRKNDLVDTRD